MKAIETKFLAATATKPARYRAFDLDGFSVTVCAPMTNANGHHVAALALQKKMQWEGELIGGYTKTGMAWVFLPERIKQ